MGDSHSSGIGFSFLTVPSVHTHVDSFSIFISTGGSTDFVDGKLLQGLSSIFSCVEISAPMSRLTAGRHLLNGIGRRVIQTIGTDSHGTKRPVHPPAVIVLGAGI